ncbi:MAG: Trk system potassium transporter TrkA [Candidatus Thermoplasmatota archaeon]|nr:Trk system potassium transporter TrkA [Candidatus Thermoplasmatota archaeon]
MKNVVIAGGGDVGFNLARTLSEEGHNITIIEKDDRETEKLEGLDILVVNGNAASPSVLQKAYINSADVFIAVTGKDEVNMAACAIAKNRGCKTFAKVNEEDYIDVPVSTEVLKDSGIDVAFCPELIASTNMANILSIPMLLDSPVFVKDMLRVLELRVDKKSKALGKEIKKIKFPKDINLVSIMRNEEILIPKGSMKIRANDRVLAVTTTERSEKPLDQLTKILGVPKRSDIRRSITKVMIAGASRIGYHLARILSEKDISVILLDEDQDRCIEISEKLSDVLVINGSPTDKELLKEEGISETDAFLAVTDKDEVNILTSLLARQYGAARSIGMVDRPDLKSILEEVGIDLIISPRSVMLSTILKYFHEDDFASLATLNQGEVQILEVKVRDRSKAANRRLDSIMRFKKRQMVIGAIFRGDIVLIPRGDTLIHPKDKLVIFTKSATLRWIKDYF